MTKLFSIAALGIGAGATILTAPHASREGILRDSSNAAPAAGVDASAATVSGRVTLIAADARASRDVASAVVYLEPVAPAPVPRPAAARPAPDSAPRPAAALATPAAPRDTVRLLWAAVQELRQTVTELREALRLLRAQLGGERVAEAATPRVETPASPPPANPAAPGGTPATAPVAGAQVVNAPARARVIASTTMAMRQKTFEPHVRVVEVGGAVDYPNRDPFSHNVFSSTPGGAFDLGLYPKGESRGAVFRRPGAYSIFCNIHAKMSAFVVAVPTPYYAHPQGDGRFSIAGVPPGRYRLHVWHERAPEQATLVTVGDRGPSDVALTLDARTFRPADHLNKFGQPYPTRGRDDY